MDVSTASVEPSPVRSALRWAAGLALALTLGGCGSGPMTVDLRPTEPARPHRPAAREIRVVLIPTADATAGVLGSRTLKPEGLDSLLAARLESLGDRHYRVAVVRQDSAAMGLASAALTISLEKAYVQQVHDSKSGVVVVKVEQAGHVSHLRGQSTGLNWWGSSEEMAGALTEALDRALAQLRPLLDAAAEAAATPSARD